MIAILATDTHSTAKELPRSLTERQLKLLGGFRLVVGREVLRVPLSGQRLVALLALRGPNPRLVVAGLLWPDVPERRALACLRTTVWRLRRLQLDVATHDYPELAIPPGLAIDAQDLSGVVADWRGGSRHRVELLPGWYDDWVLMERERIRQTLLHACEQEAEYSLALGEPAEALRLATAAEAIDPLRESAQRLVVRAHLAEGNLAEAHRHIAAVHQLMMEELGVPPSVEFCNLPG